MCKDLDSAKHLIDSIYCIPLQSPGAMIREIKAHAVVMDPVIKGILIKHPLVCVSIPNNIAFFEYHTECNIFERIHVNSFLLHNP